MKRLRCSPAFASLPLVLVALTSATAAAAGAELPDPADVAARMARVADWQLAHPSRHAPYDWTQGAYYAGLGAFAELATDAKYLQALREIAEANAYRPGPRPAHADDHTVAQAWLQLYLIDRHPRQVYPTRALFDHLARLPFDEPLEFSNELTEREWAWCDALFMSPPALTLATRATGDTKYLELMDRLWWKTTDYLYDDEEHLYYRDSRFFDARTPSGHKVFWSRGNGWVAGGLVRVLQQLPGDWPTRERYLTLYREMAAKLAAIQGEDGYWRSSLLDAESHPSPESSGTGFFVYALSWGLNRGLLDREAYLPVVLRGWQALEKAVHDDGKLGFVQQIGDSPAPTSFETTEVYGVGAFLLAGSEVYKLAMLEGSRVASVTATNPLDAPRFHETLEPDWPALVARLGATEPASLAVVDAQTGALLPSQLYDADGDGAAERLLIQSHFLANERRRFEVRALNRPYAPDHASRAYGRHVPERKDDFAWENDRIAYRMYGPALEADGEVSSGIDVWTKSVRRLVIDDWYAGDDYHVDHGEGGDFYKVGPTLGCGGLGLLADDGSLVVSRNYVRWKRLASGPIRVAFELEYAPWGPEGRQHAETKTISLDAGHFLNRIESRFEAPPAKPVAVGIVEREGQGRVDHDEAAGWLSYWEPRREDLGRTGCAVVIPGGARFVDGPDHLMLVTDAPDDGGVVYHAGGTWSESGDFWHWDGGVWVGYVSRQALAAAHPIHLAIEN